MSLLWTSMVIRLTMIFRTMGGISPRTTAVSSLSWLMMMLRWVSSAYPVLPFSLMASSVIMVQMIWEATATTWLG